VPITAGPIWSLFGIRSAFFGRRVVHD
jgi:hypothetical protein